MKTSVAAPPPAPTPVDPGKAALDYVNAMADPALQQKLYQSEATYRPQYTALNLQDINQYMMGVGGQPGALDQLGTATRASTGIQSEANTALRAADIADVSNLGQQAAAAFRQANPEMYQQLGYASQLQNQGNFYGGFQQAVQNAPQYGNVNAQMIGSGRLGQQMYGGAMNAGPSQMSQAIQQAAMTNLTADGSLNAQERRGLQQGVREAYAARGVEMGSGAVGAEALAQQQAVRQRQMENLQMAQSVNQQGLAEQESNRAYQQQVQAQELARQQQNAGMALNAGQQNRTFGASQAQQNIANLGVLGQYQQGQSAADRAYALQLAGAYGGTQFDPMMAILGRQSSATGMGQQQQGYASNLMASLQGPQLFDTSAGINMALQQNANLGNYQSSVYGAQAAAQGASNAGQGAMIGGIAGGLGSMFGGPLGGMIGKGLAGAATGKVGG